jgi:hypothetical protein
MVAGDAVDDVIDKFRKDDVVEDFKTETNYGPPIPVIKVYDEEGNLVE